MTVALALLGLALGALFVWGVDYELAGLDLDFVGASLIGFGALALLSETVGSVRTRERSRDQTGTSL